MREPRVAIVGAGLSGLLMGIKLRQAGFRDFTIYEKADGIGGTWRDNRYPGVACDVPARFYSYSFEPNPQWSELFAPGHEILAYLEHTAGRHGLWEHIRLGTAVEAARFDAEEGWRVRTEHGDEERFDFLISASGILHHPRLPQIDGLDSFAGPAFHTTRWPEGLEVAGKRVGVIGNGSSGVQLVETIAAEVDRLSLFLRTPQWIFPLPNHRYSRLGRSVVGRSRLLNRLGYTVYRLFYERMLTVGMIRPGWQRTLFTWITRQHLRVVRDPELRRKLTPSYSPMCKRIIRSTGFYPAMNRANVELVTDRIDRVEPRGVVTADGRCHELDVLVLATGFDAHAFMRPMDLVGEGGLTLAEAWAKDPRAYLTVALPGFPNFFMLIGPHSPVGHQSLPLISETQSDYIMRWIHDWAGGAVDRMAPTEEATARFNEELREALPATIWTSGCDSYYLNSEGLPALWPWSHASHRERLREPVREDFEVVAGTERTLSGAVR